MNYISGGPVLDLSLVWAISKQLGGSNHCSKKILTAAGAADHNLDRRPEFNMVWIGAAVSVS